MRTLSSLTIGQRLTAAFGFVVLMAMASAGLAIAKLQSLQGGLERIVQVDHHKGALLQRMADANHTIARVIRTLVLLNDPALMQREYRKITQAREKFEESWRALQAQPLSEEERTQLQAIEQARNVARPVNDELVRLGLANEAAAAVELLMRDGIPTMEQLQKTTDSMAQLQAQSQQRRFEQAQADYAVARNTLVGSALVLLVAAGLLAWWITRSVTRPLNQACDAAQAVAQGDLTQLLHPQGRDETARLLQALQSMQAQLAGTVREVRRDAEGVALASAEIAQGNLDLSQRTEQQASALQQSSASMAQLSGGVRENAEGAREAAALAQGASEVAERAGQEVVQVVSTMKGIEASASKIAEITGVIDGIAFQTNILALNAAVEAARAGEQGRGFAVVAGEVRSLAQRSAEAAKEIKGLIGDSVQRAVQGSTQAERAGQTMQDVVTGIRRVSGLVGEISAASAEQSSGVAQVEQAVGQMDQVTQQNAALVEQSAAAAERLSDQAQRLVQSMAVFRLPAQPGEPAAAAPTPAALATQAVQGAQRRAAATARAPVEDASQEWSRF